MNQKELAAKSGVSQATISRIEGGKIATLGSDGLTGLADALGASVDYLIGRTDVLEPGDVLPADPRAKIIFRGYEKLSNEQREQLKQFVEFLESQEEGKRKEG
jgi:transcriptional regulator with XRE-family HTH domain